MQRKRERVDDSAWVLGPYESQLPIAISKASADENAKPATFAFVNAHIELRRQLTWPVRSRRVFESCYRSPAAETKIPVVAPAGRASRKRESMSSHLEPEKHAGWQNGKAQALHESVWHPRKKFAQAKKPARKRPPLR